MNQRPQVLPRREFIKKTAQASAALTAASLPLAGCSLFPRNSSEPLYRISLAQWSYHRAFFGTDGEKRDNLEFAAISRQHGIDAVEYVNHFFKDRADDEGYLKQMKQRGDDAGVTGLLIMIDREGNLGDPDNQKRAQSVQNHHRWVRAAKALGCHSIRVNARSHGAYDEQIKLAADGLRNLSEFAVPYGISVIVENHGGLSSNGEWLASVMKTVDHPGCGTLPDFGNFHLGDGKWYDRYKGIRELMPFAKAVSAKSHDFDAEGNEVNTDYRKMMKIVLDAGYHGWVGIEYEGGNLSEPDGVDATRKLLERVRDELEEA